MLKKIIFDWSLWVLIIFNLYLLDYYQQHPTETGTLIFLYWAQSVLIGVANFFNILTLPNLKDNNMKFGRGNEPGTFGGKGCVAFFFLLHYGGFHIGYLIFILIKIDGKINFHFVQIGLAILACNLLLDFIRSKILQGQQQVSFGKIFLLPYARIVPMHLMIMLPEFLGVSNFKVFIFLKIVMDLLMHFVTSDHYRGGNSAASLSSEL